MAAVVLACSLGAPQLRAEDLTGLSIDQLLNVEVVTASKFPQKLSEAPSAVSIVTADDIRTYGYRTLADVLRSMRGLFVSYDRNYSYLGTRGSGRPGDFNARLLVLVDGVRLNDAVFSQGSIGQEFPIDLDLIDRVEYVPGPGSAIYGSNAFFGVLNIITRKGKALDGGRLSVEAASQAAGKASLGYGKRLDNGADLLVSASGYRSRGTDRYFPEYDDHDPAGSNGTAHGRDGERAQRVFAKLSYGDFGLETYFGNRVKQVPTASYGQQFDDPRSQTVDRYFSTTATWQHALSPTLDIHAQLNFSQYIYQGDYAYSLDGPTNRDFSRSNVVNAEVRFLNRAFTDHKLIYGVEATDDTRRLMQNFDVMQFNLTLDTQQPKQGYAVYVQDEYRITDRLLLSGGLRRDHDNEVGASINPRFALVAKPTPDLTSKLLYGRAFRAPNSYEQYYVTDTFSYKVVPGLKPEHIKTYELATEYFPRPDFKAGLSLYRYRLDSLITLTTDPADGLLYYKNLEAATARGIELEAEKLGREGSRFKGSIAIQATRNEATGQQLSNAPRQLVKLNYSRPVFENGFGFGSAGQPARGALELQYTSRRSTILGGSVGGFAVVNATLSHLMLTPNTELVASIYNLLGKNYGDPPSDEHFDNSTPPRYLQGIRQDGRILRLVLTTRF